MNLEKAEHRFKRLSIPHLQILRCFVSPASGATVTSQKIAEELNLEGKQAGSQLAALSKIQIDGEYLIEPRGRTSEGIRWVLNGSIRNWNDASKIIDKVLNVE